MELKIHIDDMLPNPPYKVRKADCLILCGRVVRWIIKRKGAAMKDLLDQFESTIDALLNNIMTNFGEKLEINNETLSLLVILRKGMSADRMFELGIKPDFISEPLSISL